MSGVVPDGAGPGHLPARTPTGAELEAAARALPFPAAIVGTRPDAACSGWLRGADRDVMHAQWLIEEPDAADRLRNARFMVDLGSVIDLGGVRLSDPRRLLDQHTKRIACLSLLNGRMGRLQSAPASVRSFGLSCDWFFRWRLGAGLECNAMVGGEHFPDYLACASGRGALDLVPIDARTAWLASRIADPEDDDGRILTLADVAEELGVAKESLGRAPWALAALQAALGPRFRRGPSAKQAVAPVPGDHTPVRSARSVNDALEGWRILAKLSSVGILRHDPLGVDPFAERTPLSYAREHGNDSGQRGAMPPTVTLELLDAAAKWQLEWAAPILEAVDRLRDGRIPLGPSYSGAPDDRRIEASIAFSATLPYGMPPLLLAWNQSVGGFVDPRLPGCITLAQAIGHLMTAGLVAFEAFGMLPAENALSAKKGCVAVRDGRLPELCISENGFRAVDAIPVPAMLVVVHDNLARLTAPSVGEDGVHWLFRLVRPNRPKGHTMRFPANGYLQAFCGINGIEHTDPEGAWRLTGAEPRRGMAVWYHYCNTAGSLDALSRLVGHYDPARTRAWLHGLLPGRLGDLHDEMLARRASADAALCDEERAWRAAARKTLALGRRRGTVFEGVRRESVAAIALRVAEGFETPGGVGGASLKTEMATLRGLAEADARLCGRGNDPGLVRESLLKRVESFAKDHFLWPVPSGPAHCRFRQGRKEDLAGAECLRIKASRGGSAAAPWITDDGPDVLPDHAYSGFVPCLKCPLAVVLSENRASAAAEVRRLARAVELAASPASALATREMLDELVGMVDAAEAAGRGDDA